MTIIWYCLILRGLKKGEGLLTSMDTEDGVVQVCVESHGVNIEDVSLTHQNHKGCLYTVKGFSVSKVLYNQENQRINFKQILESHTG